MTNDIVSSILSSIDIGRHRVRNRLVVAPMTRVSATVDGFPTEIMGDYYLRYAKGEFGMVITEGLYTDKAFSQGYRCQPGMAGAEQARAWAGIVEQLHDHGAMPIAQLMHAGALSHTNPYRPHTIGPSSIRPKGQQMTFYYGEGLYAEPVEISEVEIDEVIDGFVEAARRAVRIAGFRGVEIHGANGYLLDQFLTAETNRRRDRWGGDTRSRIQLHASVVRAIKEDLGGEAIVGVRLSQAKVNDFNSKWAGGEEDAKIIFAAMADAGADYIHVTEFRAWQPAFEAGSESLLALARRYAPDVTLIANGDLHSVQRANQALELGADLVALGRGALANPDLPKAIKAHRNLRDFDPSILGPVANIKDIEFT